MMQMQAQGLQALGRWEDTELSSSSGEGVNRRRCTTQRIRTVRLLAPRQQQQQARTQARTQQALQQQKGKQVQLQQLMAKLQQRHRYLQASIFAYPVYCGSSCRELIVIIACLYAAAPRLQYACVRQAEVMPRIYSELYAGVAPFHMTVQALRAACRVRLWLLLCGAQQLLRMHEITQV
jgi:hypothetical protein